MRRLLTCIIGVLALIATGCTLSSYAIVLLSTVPKEIINQAIPCPTDRPIPAKNLQVLSTHRWSKGIVLLYSGVCPGENHSRSVRRVLGYKAVKRAGMNWQVRGSESFDLETPSPSASKASQALIDYEISKSLRPKDDRYTILYGQALSPKVVAVEATFDNGQTVRDQSGDGVFALVASGATGVCQLRVLGADNQILQQEDLAIPKQFSPSRSGHRCLPVSRQL